VLRRELKSGKLKLDKAKSEAEASGRRGLISTSDEHLTFEDVVLGYKQLHENQERVNCDL